MFFRAASRFISKISRHQNSVCESSSNNRWSINPEKPSQDLTVNICLRCVTGSWKVVFFTHYNPDSPVHWCTVDLWQHNVCHVLRCFWFFEILMQRRLVCQVHSCYFIESLSHILKFLKATSGSELARLNLTWDFYLLESNLRCDDHGSPPWRGFFPSHCL